MSKTVLLVGTRKGCFLLESDESRRDWELRGPFCEGWPVYHAIHDAGSGTIYAAAASEWHGSSVWRSPDLGETWQQSSEGLNYADWRAEALEGVWLDCSEWPRLCRCGDAWGVREPGRRRDLVDPDHARGPAGSRVVERPRNQPPGHLGVPRSFRIPTTRPATGRSCRAKASSRRPMMAHPGRPGTAGCARTGRSRIPRSGTASTSS